MNKSFSDQDNGDSKIPSIIYYDDDMNPVAIGAACMKDTVIQEAEDQEWTKVEQSVGYYMILRPSRLMVVP